MYFTESYKTESDLTFNENYLWTTKILIYIMYAIFLDDYTFNINHDIFVSLCSE